MDLLEGDEKAVLSRRTLAAGLSAPDRSGAGEFNSSRGGDAGGQFSSPADGSSELQALILGGNTDRFTSGTDPPETDKDRWTESRRQHLDVFYIFTGPR